MKYYFIWNVAKADVLERMRRFSYIAVCALAVFLAFMSVPNVKAPIVSIAMEPNIFAQGTNPTWVPIAIALCGGLLTAMIGFAFVNNNIKEDRNTGNLYVWQAMGMDKKNYIIGKFLSNIILLTSIWLFIILGAAVMILLRFPNQQIKLYDFITPFLGMYLGIFFASALAVLLESIFGKKVNHLNSIGISVFFLIFLINYLNIESNNVVLRILDFSNYYWVMDSINEAVISIIGRAVQETGILVPVGMFAESGGTKELFFHGLTLNNRYILDKICLFILCLMALGVSVVFIDTKESSNRTFKKKRIRNAVLKKERYLGIFCNEWRMTFKSCKKGWWGTIACLWVASAIMNIQQVQNYIWIFAVAISVGIFSTMGSKEHENGTIELLITISKSSKKNILYSYMLGVIYLLTISLPIIIRTAMQNNNFQYMGYIAFGILIPALACFLGEFTKSRRPFETLYLLLCFLLMNKPDILFIKSFMVYMLFGAAIFISATVWKRDKY